MHPYPRGPLSLLLIGLAAVPLGAQAPRGVQLFGAGDWAGAKAEFSATIQRNDRDARAHYYLGRLAMLDDDADAAAAQFERAVALDPRSIEARDSLVDFYAMAPGFMGGGTDKARDQASAPDTLRPYSALANWYARDKRWPEAFAAFEPYFKKHPEDPYGPYGIGQIAALSGQQLDRGEQGIRAFEGKHAEARSAIEQALRLDPRNEEAKKAMK